MQMQQRGNEIWLTWPFLNEKYASLNEMTMASLVHLAKKIFQSITVLKSPNGASSPDGTVSLSKILWL